MEQNTRVFCQTDVQKFHLGGIYPSLHRFESMNNGTVTISNRNRGLEKNAGCGERDLTSREEVWADEVAAVSISEVVEDTVSVSLQKDKDWNQYFGSSRLKSTRIHANPDPEHWNKEEVT